MQYVNSHRSSDRQLFVSSISEPAAIMEKTTTIGRTDNNKREIEIISISLTTPHGAVIIPIAADTPLRCADVETLHDIARQMEALIRILSRAAEGRLRIETKPRGPEHYAVFVW